MKFSLSDTLFSAQNCVTQGMSTANLMQFFPSNFIKFSLSDTTFQRQKICHSGYVYWRIALRPVIHILLLRLFTNEWELFPRANFPKVPSTPSRACCVDIDRTTSMTSHRDSLSMLASFVTYLYNSLIIFGHEGHIEADKYVL